MRQAFVLHECALSALSRPYRIPVDWMKRITITTGQT